MTNNRFAPNPERREKVRAVKDFASQQKDGARMSWLEIEIATGVAMDEVGRNIVRAVLDRTHRPYLSLPGYGIELSSPDNGLDIVDASTRRLAGAFRGARETSDQVSMRHLEAMKPEAKSKLIATQALLQTMDLSKSLAKR